MVALNNSETAATAAVPTFSPSGVRYQLVSSRPDPRQGVPQKLTTGAGRGAHRHRPAARLRHLPGRRIRCRRATRRPASTSPASSTATRRRSRPTSWDGHEVVDRIEVAAELDADALAEVTFAVRVGDGEYVPIGTDDNAPYRVFYDASHLQGEPPTTLSFRAIVNDLSGHLAADEVVNIGVEFPEPGPAGDAVRRDPLQPARRRLRRPHDRQLQRLLGPAPVGRRPSPRRRSPTGRRRSPSSARTSTAASRSSSWLDDNAPVNFIVHRGDTKDPDDSPDRSFDPAPRRRSGCARAT